MGNNGIKNASKPNAGKIPGKPSMKEIEREVGKNIVKTKLPRARYIHMLKIHKKI